MKKPDKKNRISYYVGWGLAFGTFAGGMLSVMFPEYLLAVHCSGIAIGAAVGAVYGKLKVSK